jgi:hypothetical protein
MKSNPSDKVTEKKNIAELVPVNRGRMNPLFLLATSKNAIELRKNKSLLNRIAHGDINHFTHNASAIFLLHHVEGIRCCRQQLVLLASCIRTFWFVCRVSCSDYECQRR